MLSYLRSLVALNGTGRGRVSVEGRLFKVPAFTPEQKKVFYFFLLLLNLPNSCLTKYAYICIF